MLFSFRGWGLMNVLRFTAWIVAMIALVGWSFAPEDYIFGMKAMFQAMYYTLEGILVMGFQGTRAGWYVLGSMFSTWMAWPFARAAYWKLKLKLAAAAIKRHIIWVSSNLKAIFDQMIALISANWMEIVSIAALAAVVYRQWAKSSSVKHYSKVAAEKQEASIKESREDVAAFAVPFMMTLGTIASTRGADAMEVFDSLKKQTWLLRMFTLVDDFMSGVWFQEEKEGIVFAPTTGELSVGEPRLGLGNERQVVQALEEDDKLAQYPNRIHPKGKALWANKAAKDKGKEKVAESTSTQQASDEEDTEEEEKKKDEASFKDVPKWLRKKAGLVKDQMSDTTSSALESIKKMVTSDQFGLLLQSIAGVALLAELRKFYKHYFKAWWNSLPSKKKNQLVLMIAGTICGIMWVWFQDHTEKKRAQKAVAYKALPLARKHKKESDWINTFESSFAEESIPPSFYEKGKHLVWDERDKKWQSYEDSDSEDDYFRSSVNDYLNDYHNDLVEQGNYSSEEDRFEDYRRKTHSKSKHYLSDNSDDDMSGRKYEAELSPRQREILREEMLKRHRSKNTGYEPEIKVDIVSGKEATIFVKKQEANNLKPKVAPTMQEEIVNLRAQLMASGMDGKSIYIRVPSDIKDPVMKNQIIVKELRARVNELEKKKTGPQKYETVEITETGTAQAVETKVDMKPVESEAESGALKGKEKKPESTTPVSTTPPQVTKIMEKKANKREKRAAYRAKVREAVTFLNEMQKVKSKEPVASTSNSKWNRNKECEFADKPVNSINYEEEAVLPGSPLLSQGRMRKTVSVLDPNTKGHLKMCTKVGNKLVTCFHPYQLDDPNKRGYIQIGDELDVAVYDGDMKTAMAKAKLLWGDAARDWMVLEFPKSFGSAGVPTFKAKILSDDALRHVMILGRESESDVTYVSTGLCDGTGRRHDASTKKGFSGSGMIATDSNYIYGVHTGNGGSPGTPNTWSPFDQTIAAHLN